MAREYFKNLPDTSTPLTAERFNGFLNGEESIEKLVVGDIECKQLFDKNNINKLNAYINDSNKTIVSNSNARTLYIKCESNTIYTFSKIAGRRFIVSSFENIPAIGSVGTNEVHNNTASNLTITTGANDKYLALFYYLSGTDTLTEQEILDSIQIELGDKATDKVDYKKFGYNSVDSMGEIVVDDIICKNILQNDLTSTTVDNLTITVNEDKSITLNGTAPSGTKLYTIGKYKFKNGKAYTISGVIGFTSSTLQIQAASSTAFPVGSRLATYNGPTTRVAQADEICNVNLYTYGGTTYNNVTIYPQIEEKDEATSYTPFKQFDCTAYKLWENPSPTSEFAGQTITLSDDITNYRYYEVIYRLSTGTAYIFNTGKIPVGSLTALLSAYNKNYKRVISAISGTSVTFGNGQNYSTYGGSTTDSNSYLIPVEILAYK